MQSRVGSQKRGHAQISFEKTRIDPKSAGRIGETDVVDAYMRLRQDNENRLALRDRGEAGHLADLRLNLEAQGLVEKAQGAAAATIPTRRKAAEDPDRARRAPTRPQRCGSEWRHFDHGSQTALKASPQRRPALALALDCVAIKARRPYR